MVVFSKLPVMISDEDIVDKRYENGKIYVVRCKYDDTLVYVGSTFRKLKERFRGHKNEKNCSLYKYVNGDWDNWYIELYQNYPCKNKTILERREGDVQREIATINQHIVGRSHKEWREVNRKNLLMYKKEYHIKNRDLIIERKRQYRINNREYLLDKSKERMICDVCGKNIHKTHKARHQQTIKCINNKPT
jgi:hypothetical protein